MRGFGGDAIALLQISVNECTILRRVLGSEKMDVMPRSCKMMNTAQVGDPSAPRTTASGSEDGSPTTLDGTG